MAELIQLEEQLYKIAEMEERAVGDVSTFGKNGIHLRTVDLKSYGFEERETFKYFALEARKILLEKN